MSSSNVSVPIFGSEHHRTSPPETGAPSIASVLLSDSEEVRTGGDTSEPHSDPKKPKPQTQNSPTSQSSDPPLKRKGRKPQIEANTRKTQELKPIAASSNGAFLSNVFSELSRERLIEQLDSFLENSQNTIRFQGLRAVQMMRQVDTQSKNPGSEPNLIELLLNQALDWEYENFSIQERAIADIWVLPNRKPAKQ